MTWQEKKIGSFCDTGSGGTPSRERLSEYYGGKIPWIKSGELRESVILQAGETITEAGLANSSAKIVPAGALLVAMYGATVGRVGILGIRAATNQAVCHIVPRGESADTRYLFHCLQAKLPEFLSRSVGGAQPNISQEIIKETSVPLPPLEEQRRIAAILDKADALRQKRRAALQKLDSLTQSLFLDMFGDGNGKMIRLGELAEVRTGGTPSRETEANFGGDIPWVKTTEVTGDEILRTSELITKQGLASSNCRVFPKESIIVAMYGQGKTRGQCSMLGIEAATNQACAVILPNEQFRPRFLLAVLKNMYSELRSLARGGNQANLNLEIIRDIEIALPDIQLQAVFERRLAAVSCSRSRFAVSFDSLELIFDSLQHRAFRGEL